MQSPSLRALRPAALLAVATGLALASTALVGLSDATRAPATAAPTIEPRAVTAAKTHRVTLYLPSKAGTAKRKVKVTFSPKKPTKVKLQRKKNGTFVTIKTKKKPTGSRATFTYDPPNGKTTKTRIRAVAIWKSAKAITRVKTTTWAPGAKATKPTATTGTSGSTGSGGSGTPSGTPTGVLDANGDPTVNLGEPSSLNACGAYGSTDARCVNAAVGAINTGRDREGLRRFALPSNWYSLTPADQLLVISNDERSARGLRTISRLSTALNLVAMTGASTNSDPLLAGWTVEENRQALGWASNWAITPGGPLYSTYLWMYDDGPGSGNIDCTASNTSGCWGHRHNVLAFGAADPSTSLILGAAETRTTYGGWSGLSDATILVKILG